MSRIRLDLGTAPLGAVRLANSRCPGSLAKPPIRRRGRSP